MPMKLLIIAFVTLLMNSLPLSANVALSGSNMAVESTLNKDPFPLKNSKHYDEANDPAFKRCGTNSSGPQHGYFTVPLLILGLAGVLLYVSKSP